MPDIPTSASGFLLQELRQARATAGLSQEDLGKAINYSSSLVSAVELGHRAPTRDYLAAVDKALNTGGFLERTLTDVVSLDRAPVWLRDWIVIEREATLIRWFEPLLVPGLLQTEAYARAVLERDGLLTPGEVERSVASRLDRQQILSRPTPPTLIALIDEGVLYRSTGDAAMMAEQCDHLLAHAAKAHIHLHVVPAHAGTHPGMAGPFILAKGVDLEAAHLDNALRAQVIDRRAALDRLARKWEAIRSDALPRTLSIQLIREVARTWQT